MQASLLRLKVRAMTFPHHHLFGIKQLSRGDVETILGLAAHYAQTNCSPQKKSDRLAGKIVVNMFFENSTRTRTSFEVAAKRLSADVVNFNAAISSMNKGESFADTLRMIDATHADACVIRHAQDGMAQEAAKYFKGAVINAGDGAGEHPTQALLDALTVQRHKGTLENLTIAVCGDIKHSRVARSNALLWKLFGSKARFFAPPAFAFSEETNKELGVISCSTLDEAIEGADVVMMLRVQNERLKQGEAVLDPATYNAQYGLNHERLKRAKKDVIVMHPAPMNRGVEITDELADDPKYSVIFEQMEMGVAVRTACLDLLVR